jgi:hypothetical protein
MRRAGEKGVAMARKLGPILMVWTLAICASAAVNPGSISGYVKNSTGVPQMGAMVEVLTAAGTQTLYTDPKGFFTTAGLLPGTYAVRVSAPSFLPSLRENIRLDSGATLLVNVTLNTLFEAVQMLPARAHSAEERDDWKWTLRSASNRPILRVLDDDALVVVSKSENEKDKVLKARVAFIAGNDGGFGGAPDMSTSFSLEQSVFSSGTLAFNGDVGYGDGVPNGVLRTSYSREMGNGSKPQVTLTVRRYGTPQTVANGAALQSLALSVSDSMQIGDLIGLNYGSELQTVQFMGRANAFRPFGSAELHLGANTVAEYRYASSIPTTRRMKGYDTAPADLTETDPRVALIGNEAKIERAHHHEIALSHRLGDNRFQAAVFSDRINNVVLNGVGQDVPLNGDFLPDIYSGTFNFAGQDLSTNGLRMVYERQVNAALTATLDYAFGGVLTLDKSNMEWSQVRTNLRTRDRHAFTTKIAGTVPHTKTKMVASYKWTSGDALTAVDMFNVSPGQADPFLNIFVRQPLPRRGFIPANVEALIDVRNLLAQGYMPLMGQDGQTIYLVQAARSVRGGLSFTF